MPYPQIHRLVVIGGERVGKTAIIEQLIFGNHVIGQVGSFSGADNITVVCFVSRVVCLPLVTFMTLSWKQKKEPMSVFKSSILQDG